MAILSLHGFISLSLEHHACSNPWTCLALYNLPPTIRFWCRSSGLISTSASVRQYTSSGHFFFFQNRRESMITLPITSIRPHPEPSVICKRHKTSKSNCRSHLYRILQRSFRHDSECRGVMIRETLHHRARWLQPQPQVRWRLFFDCTFSGANMKFTLLPKRDVWRQFSAIWVYSI